MAASVSDFMGRLYNFSQLLFFPGHGAAEPESAYKGEMEFNYTLWWNTIKSCNSILFLFHFYYLIMATCGLECQSAYVLQADRAIEIKLLSLVLISTTHCGFAD